MQKKEKTGNLVTGDGYKTDAEVDNEKQEANAKEEQKKLVQINIKGKDIQGVKAIGVLDSKSSDVSQSSLKSVASGTACTLTVWYMIGLDFAEEGASTKPLNEAYNSTSKDEIDKSNGFVYASGPNAMMLQAGGSGYEIGSTCYADNNGIATQTMVNTLNEGGKIYLRVTPDGGTDGGHSVKVDNYAFDETGKFYMTVKILEENLIDTILSEISCIKWIIIRKHMMIE